MTRRYGIGLEPVGTALEAVSKGVSKSAVSRRFVALTSHALGDMLSAELSSLDIVVLFVDGFSFGEHLMVGALEGVRGRESRPHGEGASGFVATERSEEVAGEHRRSVARP